MVFHPFSECQQKQINLSIAKGASLAKLGAEWIVADPGRLNQILINFLSNSGQYSVSLSCSIALVLRQLRSVHSQIHVRVETPGHHDPP
jgi:signal transduction histidine kinase